MTPSLRDRARNSLSLTMMSETQERADFKMKQEQQEGIRESKATDRGGGGGPGETGKANNLYRY